MKKINCIMFLLLGSITILAGEVEKNFKMDWNMVLGGGYRGVWSTDNGIEMVGYYPVEENCKLLVIEAEKSSSLKCYKNGGIQKDTNSSNGSYVLNPQSIELFMDLKKPLEYSIWYKVKFLDKSNETRFLEGLNPSLGGPVGWVSLKKQKDGWQWLKGNIRHNFKRRGMFEFQMDQIPKGLALDTIVMAKDEHWSPENATPPFIASKATPWIQAKLETEDLYFAQVSLWQKVVCNIDPRDGKARFQYSTDSGKKWFNVPTDGNLSTIKTNSDGRDKIRFRIQMSRSHEGSGPLIAPKLELTYSSPSDSLLTIEDELAKYYFARKNGALCGIENKKTHTTIIPIDVPTPVFSLQIKKPGFISDKQPAVKISDKDTPEGHDVYNAPENHLERLTSLKAECLGVDVDKNPGNGFYCTLTSRYILKHQQGDINITLTVKFKAPGEAHWLARVTNNLQGLEICEFIYPVLNRVKLSDKNENETLLINGNYLVKQPSQWGHFCYWWPGCEYPMLDISTAKEGISLIAHDKSMRSTGISAMGQNKTSTRLQLIKAVCIRPGQTYEGPDNLIRVHNGDWENACFLEKEWAQAAFPPVESSLWAQELDLFSMTGWPVPRWDLLGPLYADANNPLDFKLLGMWNFQIPGTYWSAPHPNPIMGDAEDFHYAVKEFRKSGIRFIVYIQSLLWDPNAESNGNPDKQIGYLQRRHLWPEWEMPKNGFAQQNCVRNINGKKDIYSPENLNGKYFNTPMDQGSPGFYEFKYHWTVELFGKKLGLDGIYYDSDSGYFGKPSWRGWQEKNFDPGLQGKAALENALRIRDAYKKQYPNAVFVGEGAPCAAMHLARDFTLQNLYSVWPIKIMFPKMKLMANTRDYDKAFLAGLCYIGKFISGDETKTAKSLTKDLGMRRLVNQYLYAGEFHNEKEIGISNPKIRAKVFYLNDKRNKGFLINILNPKKIKGAFIDVDAGNIGPLQYGWIVQDDLSEGKLEIPMPLSGSNYKYRIPVPADEKSHLLLFNRAEPRIIISKTGELTAGGETTLKIKVTSIAGDQKGSIGICMPDYLKDFIDADNINFDVDYGKTKEYLLKIKSNAKTTADIITIPVCTKPEKSESFLRPVSIYVHEPLDIDLKWVSAEQIEVTVSNRLNNECKGKLTLKAVKGSVSLSEGDFSRNFTLKGNAAKTYLIKISGASIAQKPWTIKGTLNYKTEKGGFLFWNRNIAKSIPVYQKFWPIIPNGKLELYDFRKGAPDKEYYPYSKQPDKMESFIKNIPDYWWGMISDRSPRISFRSGISVEKDPVQGRCFKLKPGSNCRCLVIVNLAKGIRYRLRVKIKSSNPSVYDAVSIGRYINSQKYVNAVQISLSPKAKANTWHTLEKEFVSEYGGSLSLRSGSGEVWFDDFDIIPIKNESDKKIKTVTEKTVTEK